MAERVGFEPTNTREDVTGIPVQRLRPLGHLSIPHITAHRFRVRPVRGECGARILATAGSPRLLAASTQGALRTGAGASGGGTTGERTGGPRVSGTAKLGGNDRQGSDSGREGSGSFSAGMRTALCVSGALIPAGTWRGARLAVLVLNLGSWQPTTGPCRWNSEHPGSTAARATQSNRFRTAVTPLLAGSLTRTAPGAPAWRASPPPARREPPGGAARTAASAAAGYPRR